MKRAFLIFLLSLGFSLSANSEYRIIDLKVPKARSLFSNDKSQICGTFTTEKGHAKLFFLDPKFGLQEIGVPYPGGVYYINNNGFVAGNYNVLDDAKQGLFLHSALFLWSQEQGFNKIVEAPVDLHAQVLSLNDSNKVIYSLQNNKTGERRLLIWESGFSYDISDIFSSVKINNKEEFFGYDSKSGNLKFYNPNEGICENILFFKGYCDIVSLTDTGIAAGTLSSQGSEYGFKWSKENGIELFEDFRPKALNDKGEMVGNFCTVLDINGKKTDIVKDLRLEFDPSSPWHALGEISSINSKGEIVGTAYKDHGFSNPHAVLIKKWPS